MGTVSALPTEAQNTERNRFFEWYWRFIGSHLNDTRELRESFVEAFKKADGAVTKEWKEEMRKSLLIPDQPAQEDYWLENWDNRIDKYDV